MRKLAFVFSLLSFLCGAEVQADENILVALSEIKQNYIKQTSTEDLAIIALKSLNKIDKKIQVANDGTRITLYYNTKVFKNFNKPAHNQVSEWTSLIDKIIAAYSQISNKIMLKDYEISDIMIHAIVQTLDQDSKYHTAFSLADENAFERKKYFSERRIGDILYVRMLGFSDDVSTKFENTIQTNKDAKGMVLDLRGNSGGSLKAVMKIGNLLLDGGVMFESNGRDKSMNLLYEAEEKDMFEEKPIVVLIDGNTASSAEILAGVLQQQSRAKLVGSTSYGKSTSQKIIKLPNASVLMLTNAKLSLPSGHNFSVIGLTPDYCLNGETEFNENKNINNCPKENRLHYDEDIDIAIKVLKMQI